MNLLSSCQNTCTSLAIKKNWIIYDNLITKFLPLQNFHRWPFPTKIKHKKYALLYTWKVSPGENFTTCSHWQKIFHANFLSCVNDCIEDMVTMSALAKNLSIHQNTKVAGLGKIENFHVNSMLSNQSLRKSHTWNSNTDQQKCVVQNF